MPLSIYRGDKFFSFHPGAPAQAICKICDLANFLQRPFCSVVPFGIWVAQLSLGIMSCLKRLIIANLLSVMLQKENICVPWHGSALRNVISAVVPDITCTEVFA